VGLWAAGSNQDDVDVIQLKHASIEETGEVTKKMGESEFSNDCFCREFC